MRRDHSDEIEFRYSRFGGHAKGRFAILIFAGLVALAFVASMFICWRVTTVGIAYSEHLSAPHSQTVKMSLGEKQKGFHAETRRRREGGEDFRVGRLFENPIAAASPIPPRLRVKLQWKSLG